jgi:hypothetical protein
VADHGARERRIPKMVLGCGEYIIPNCEHTNILSDPTDKSGPHHPIVFMIFGAQRPLVPAPGNGTCTARATAVAEGVAAVALLLSFPLLNF